MIFRNQACEIFADKETAPLSSTLSKIPNLHRQNHLTHDICQKKLRSCEKGRIEVRTFWQTILHFFSAIAMVSTCFKPFKLINLVYSPSRVSGSKASLG